MLRTACILGLASSLMVVGGCGDDSGTGGSGGQGGTTGTGGSTATGGGSTGGGSTGGGSTGGGGAAETFTHEGREWTLQTQTDIPWQNADGFCKGLDVAGATDWRLATIDELRTLIVGCPATMTGGTCAVTAGCLNSTPDCRDDSCAGCSQAELPPQGCFWPVEAVGDCVYYWASDGVSDMPGWAWGVGFNGAHVSSLLMTDVGAARCTH